MTREERSLLEGIDKMLLAEEVRAQIQPVVERVRAQLQRKTTTVMAWEPIPLSIYGDALPAMIRSSWVFILRAGTNTGAERHPNSHQRMRSFEGSGDMQVGDDEQTSDVGSQRSEGAIGAVRTSVTLLGQNIGNTLLLIVYTSFVSSAVLFGRISARIKLLAERSIWPRSSRPNQTSIIFSLMGLSPTDQPAKLVLRKSLWPFTLIVPLLLTRRVNICEYSRSSGVPSYFLCEGA